VPKSRLRLRENDLDWREVEGELVVLDLRKSRYLAINPTGRVLWAALAAGATQNELIERLIKAFDVDRVRAGADVDAFISELESRDLLLHEPADPRAS
jgi:hypothetical protein